MQTGQGLDYDSAFMESVRDRAEERSAEAKKRISELSEKLERLRKDGEIEVSALTGSEGTLGESQDSVVDEITGLEEAIRELQRQAKGVSRGDYDETLRELEEEGLVDYRSGSLNLTSKGARILGRGLLIRILGVLEKRGVGTHRIDYQGEGAWTGSTLRPYEYGDPYHKIDFERTLLSTLERAGKPSQVSVEDFWVKEPVYNTELHLGILVDQSASMRGKGKIEAAVETALALSELMRQIHPEDRLEIYSFSEVVKKVQPWSLGSATIPMGFTDIRAALRAFRVRCAHETGNRQAYLITDSAPNYIDGGFVGFSKAMEAVITEARLYRAKGIVLNIIMLDEDEQLRQMARRVARENLGRVAYVEPGKLGEAVVEDYLSFKSSLTG